jgi:hypothetical protein
MVRVMYMNMNGQRDTILLTLQMELGGHKPGSIGHLLKLKKRSKEIYFQHLLKGTQSC